MVFRKTLLQIYFRGKNQWKSPAVLFNISVNVSAMTRERQDSVEPAGPETGRIPWNPMNCSTDV
jgi:hypothetical protein